VTDIAGDRDSELDRWADTLQPFAQDEALESVPPPVAGALGDTERRRVQRQKVVIAAVCGLGALVFALAGIRFVATGGEKEVRAVPSPTALAAAPIAAARPAPVQPTLAPPSTTSTIATPSTKATTPTISTPTAATPPAAAAAAAAAPADPASSPQASPVPPAPQGHKAIAPASHPTLAKVPPATRLRASRITHGYDPSAL
jgi:hypothetical protein